MTDRDFVEQQGRRLAAPGIVGLFTLLPFAVAVAGWLAGCEVCHLIEPLFYGWTVGGFLCLSAGAWGLLCVGLAFYTGELKLAVLGLVAVRPVQRKCG